MMRAVVVHAAKDLRIDELPTPVAGPGEVAVRVVYGGICGSDLHYYGQGRNGAFVVNEPMILGHEVVGVIEATGDGVAADVVVGGSVAIHPARPTPPPGGVAGRGYHLLPGSYLGSAATTPHTQGAFAERIIVNEDQLRHVPYGVPLRRAALAEPLAVALHGVAQAGLDYAGKRVAVFGAGPIGCLAVAALRERGAAEIVAIDLQAAPLQTARALGAGVAVQLGVDEPVAAGSFDVAIEASGSPRALSGAIDAVVAGGTIVQLGILPAGDLPVNIGPIVAKEIKIHGSQRFDIELDEAIALIARTPALDEVVTHVFTLSDAVDAFETAMAPGASLKVLLQISAEPGQSAVATAPTL